ncbi:hypothetical protein FZEAL_5633 [Fusarium zealandicum]|uniref:Uncharacterized protein n=1 Tax=Fusarium zealandicum TaxID=1053134 RepID=A0A8H4UJT1_9HYPO|nr:hypothetical protein FZEAL_5633 [Fusarium zealandicum]
MELSIKPNDPVGSSHSGSRRTRPLPKLELRLLPVGRSFKEEDRRTAKRLCVLLCKYAPTMPLHAQEDVIECIRAGEYRHVEESLHDPDEHPLYRRMYDDKTGTANWYEMAYCNWFVLSGVYGFDHPDLGKIRAAMMVRYGDGISKGLEYPGGPRMIPELQLADEIV